MVVEVDGASAFSNLSILVCRLDKFDCRDKLAVSIEEEVESLESDSGLGDELTEST